MRKRIRNSALISTQTMEPIVKLWVSRILLGLNAHTELVQRNHFQNEKLAHQMGLGHWVDADDFDVKKVIKDLKVQHAKLEQASDKVNVPMQLRENIESLAGFIDLNSVEKRLLQFVVILHSDQALGDVTDFLGELSAKDVDGVIAHVLKIEKEKIQEALKPSSILAQSGLMCIEKGCPEYLRRKFSVISDHFVEALLLPAQKDSLAFMNTVVQPSAKATLSLENYAHLEKELKIIVPHIQQALQNKKSGVNVFIYGPPGTGKSEFVRALANHFGVELREISNQDEDADSIGGSKRLRAYRAAQCFFSKQKTLLLFDEIEDVFNDATDFFGMQSTAKRSKAWINKMLEENPVPTFWLSNSSYIDSAFIRRFDMCIEMPVPRKKQRAQIIRENCIDFLSESQIERFAMSENLSPAVVNKAAKVIQGIKDSFPEGYAVNAFETLVNNTLDTQGYKKIEKQNGNALPDFYKPDYVHCKQDLRAVRKNLEHCQSARICLYGPPGTGKTAYGRWLSQELDKPLIIKKASDLISMWVGETEKNIARAFDEADSENAILLIDEVDSFLQDRHGATRSWEVTQVNEMLTQMESFNGIFIASTNLMDNLDQAALRRFDVKLFFDFMRSDQAVNLFKEYAAQFKVAIDNQAVLSELVNLKNLTPGDYAAISRRHRFMPIENAEQMLQSLVEDCALKGHSQRSIGFV